MPQKSVRIRLYPNEEQRQTLRRWMGVARWTYNQCLEAVNSKLAKRTKKDLRDYCINSSTLKERGFDWVMEVPYDIRDQAMNDLLKAYKTCFSKGEQFRMRFRSKKNSQQSIVIRPRDWARKRGEYAFLSKIKSTEVIPDDLRYESRIVMDRLGHFYLCIPKPLDMRCENQAPGESSVIALDPGVRTFQTCYDPSGKAFEWGKGDISRIYRLCHAYDKLQSKWSQKDVRHRQRYRMKRAGLRIQYKIRNLIGDVHKKMVNWLCCNYNVILLPSFETSQMLRKGQRRIRSKAARAMATWAHYRFKQRLLHKAREFPWCTPIICDEHYTSKTCGRCGHINNKLGGSKTFICPKCDFTLDRDINGARNILIRYLTLHCNTSGLLGDHVGSCPLPSQ